MFQKRSHTKSLLRKRILLPIILLSFPLLLLFICDSRLTVRRYELDAPEIAAPVRIALITDLHSCRYGSGQTDLLNAVDAQSPDLILLGGDIFDDVIDDANSALFLAGIAEKYPCRYVPGNHEYWSGAERFTEKMAILEQYGIPNLAGKCETLSINGQTFNLCGADDPDAYIIKADPSENPAAYEAARYDKEAVFANQLAAVSEAAQNNLYTILLAHRPEYFSVYQSYSFDLVLCGHAHGGQWRIPGLLNGLYAPDQGLFPPYAGGEYSQNGTTMIVSRGLARESTRLPRIFNRPELVIVDLV